MSDGLVIHKGRTATVKLEFNEDITGDTITSEIRTEPDQSSSLIMEFAVSVTNAANGSVELTANDTVTGQIQQNSGYMDVKRVTSGGDVPPVFDRPIKVQIRGTVTS